MLQDYRVFEMLTLAQDMGVFELRAACEDHVISTLSVDNACTFLTAVMDIHEKAGASLLYYTFMILLYRAYSIRKKHFCHSAARVSIKTAVACFRS